MKTAPVDNNGTDLMAVAKHNLKHGDCMFISDNLPQEELNYLYNMADVTINMASNEGFGLGTAESLMTGTPIVVNVTGGLQDQCGFKIKDKFIDYKDYSEIKSLHDWKKWEHNSELTWGDWVKPVWPKTRSLMGSVPTPYIFDDRCDWEDASDKIKQWYEMDKDERRKCGIKGHYFVKSTDSNMSAKNMCRLFYEHMETAFEKFEPRKKFNIYKG